ncbi:MAG: hypothetical protein ACK5L6_06135 [Anaerorhabdus sp.]|uniref:hypothetical protein n=1 Tax=Anaerorhabdus sp. TaxID=1872524 RepID=UPI003A8946E5
MNIGIETIKQLLNYLCDNLILDDDGYFNEIDLNEELPNRSQLAEMTDGEIAYLVKELSNVGLLETKHYIAYPKPVIIGLDYSIYLLRDKLNSSTKETLIEFSKLSLPAIITKLL